MNETAPLSNAITYGAGKTIEIDVDIQVDQARLVVVEAHGGTIAVASKAGSGSTFTVLLPRARQGCAG